jgi:hypothetical protein
MMCNICGVGVKPWEAWQFVVLWDGRYLIDKPLCDVCFRWADRCLGKPIRKVKEQA